MRISFDAELIGAWVCEKAGGTWQKDDRAIGVIDKDGGIVAGIKYDGYTGSSISMHSRCDFPSRVPRLFYSIIFDYPFNQLKVVRVNGIVSSSNLKAQRVNLHLGFKEDARIADYFADGDAIIYGMYREDCRFLKGKYAIQPF